jgi:serine/threonine protein kinase/formylglycine-generating enzyme required for sulfatase activity
LDRAVIPAVDPDWSPPDEFDEYRVVRPLGRGTMGQVYLAYDTVLARHVAIKFIATLDPDPAARHRFLVEARAAARLQHPNVVTIHHVGELGEQPYLVSEFINGQTLDRITRPVAWQRALQIGLDLARGLAAAHQEGVLHRDIKPANIILAEDGCAKLLDFGLAKLVEERPARPNMPPEAGRAPEPSAGQPGPWSERLPWPAVDAERTLPPVSSRLAPDLDRVMAATTPYGTGLGAVMGTPYYMAPEIWQGQEATRRSDVYALGAVLYELCTGRPPHHGVSVPALPRVTAEQDVRSLALASDGPGSQMDARFAALVDRCLARAQERRFASGEDLVEALKKLERTAGGIALAEGNPYRGLHPFDAQHRGLFFGRSREVSLLLDRLRRESFLVVAGDSGVGKSSLCRAGLLPLVEEGILGEGRSWRVLQIVPGRRPDATMASALAAHLGKASGSLPWLSGGLADGRNAPWITLGRLLGDGLGLVVFIDQLEELSTLSDPDEAATLARLLADLAVGIPGIRLLATARTDFLTRLAGLPGLGPSVSRALYLLPPLSAERMREAVIGPAAATGLRFESEAVVDALVEHTAEGGHGLPLLQFALAELWEARDREHHFITAQALAVIGGVAGALARHADIVLTQLLPAERAAARRILTRLVTVEGTSASLSEAELVRADASAPSALDALVRGRLVVVQEAEGTSACKLAHEALIHGWATLHTWLEEDSGRRALRERLARAAKDWERLGRAPEALWSTRQLAETARLGLTAGKVDATAAETEVLQPGELAFLQASRRSVGRARWLRRALLLGLALALALGYGGLRLQARQSMDRRVAAALTEARHALTTARVTAGEAERLRRLAFARFDAPDRAAGEARWAEALGLGRTVDRDQARASQTLEAALVLDPTRDDVRALLADVLYARALVAEQERRWAQVDELLERLALYDTENERRHRWDAPARLGLSSFPAGATVTLTRFVEDDRHKLHLAEPRHQGTTPLEIPGIAPGSYLLTLAAAGRTTVRYPLTLGRDQRVQLALELPSAGDIPAGLVYIPAGKFLFGSGAEEDLRRGFFNTVPQHEMSTGAYLIGRTEVTFAAWLEFLRELPADQRRRRTPHVVEGGFTGSLALDELPGGRWQLTFQPSAARYTATAGEQIHYRSRTHHASQDWLQFPVAGIAAEDAEAYLEWLRLSGRVPGARLCSEAEWERAARGADAREFPHGGRLDPEDADFDETYDKNPAAMGPDEVGSHPASRSPFGVDDLCGSVFEWTTSSLDPGDRVVRGGSYLYDRITNQISNRQMPVATFRDANIGLRVCATVPAR